MSELERPRSGLSVASSVATISSVTLGSKPIRSVKKVHTFGKRENAIRRDQNAPVVVRGWLYKQDSAGLRLWKRRWFVLSDFCLFYYRDSREETVLGSILLPSYEILPVSTKEGKNRKFAFKAEHPGMRTYHFSADTQEDMSNWIRAMNQSALAVADNNNKLAYTLPGRTGALPISCPPLGTFHSSYEEFQPCGLPPSCEYTRSAESLEITHLSETQSVDESGGSPRQGRSFSRPAQDAAAPLSTPISGCGKLETTAENGSMHYARTQGSQLSQGLDYPHDSYPSPPIPKTLSPREALSPPRMYSLEGTERDWERRQDKALVLGLNSTFGHQPTPRHCLRIYPEPPASPPSERTTLVRPLRSYSLPTTPSDLSRPRALAISPPLRRSEALGAVARKAASLTPRLHQKARTSLGHCQAASCEELSLMDSPTLNSRSLTRPHTPVGRVDILPDSEMVLSPSSGNHGKERLADRYRGQLGTSYSRPQTPSDRYDVLPFDDPYLSLARPVGHVGRYSKRLHVLAVAEQERLAGGDRANLPHRMQRASNSRPQVFHHPTSPSFSQLPPLPPVSGRPVSHPTPGKRLSLSALAPGSRSYKERMLQLGRRTENDMDALLTRLCGQDKLLISLEGDWGQLQAEKEALENALDLTRLHLEELQGREPEVMEKIWVQQRVLQDDLVQVRARICDHAVEMEDMWQEYQVLEKELHVLRDSLEHLQRMGHPQEQVAAQRDLWMIDDIVSGLRANKNNFHMVREHARHPPLFIPASPVLNELFAPQRNFLQLADLEPPGPRKKPRGPAEAYGSNESTAETLEAGGIQLAESSRQITGEDHLGTSSQGPASNCVSPQPCSLLPGPSCSQVDGDLDAKTSPASRSRRQRMSAEEQLERMRRHWEAQIPERVKSPRRRVPPPRSSVGNGWSRLTGTDPQPAGCNGIQLDQLTTGPPDAQKPTLVTVKASYLPLAMVAPGKTGAAVGLQGQSEEREMPGMPEGTPSSCRSQEVMPAASLVRTSCDAPAAPPQLRDRSEIMLSLSRDSKAAREFWDIPREPRLHHTGAGADRQSLLYPGNRGLAAQQSHDSRSFN
ncbi:pleckstrin homology domain-containing family A member 4 isoform X2 [Microcaecilia unicolor]|uniref:Pleckstrin homology domain-containing family A member 4 isoform X2 n=1 Tax=Microcaecilia unicolor TaxID=1415580 RepID=A0A6P7XTB4_9AMPH|nr:pleckstrin homology domain-containing family A member 4 isoform X2 [Microcaecilia unicolor]